MWYPEAAETLAGTLAFSLMDMSRRKEPSFFLECRVGLAVVCTGSAPCSSPGMRIQVEAGSEGAIAAECSSVGVDARNLGGLVHSGGGSQV